MNSWPEKARRKISGQTKPRQAHGGVQSVLYRIHAPAIIYALLPQWVRSSPSGLASTVAAWYALLPQWACSSPSSGLAPRPHRRPLRQDCPRGVQRWTLLRRVHDERRGIFMLHHYRYSRCWLLLGLLVLQWRLGWRPVQYHRRPDVLRRHPQPHAKRAPRWCGGQLSARGVRASENVEPHLLRI